MSTCLHMRRSHYYQPHSHSPLSFNSASLSVNTSNIFITNITQIFLISASLVLQPQTFSDPDNWVRRNNLCANIMVPCVGIGTLVSYRYKNDSVSMIYCLVMTRMVAGCAGVQHGALRVVLFSTRKYELSNSKIFWG